MASLITAALVAILMQNIVFERLFGLNALLYASRKKSHVIGFTLGMCYIVIIASAITWGLNQLLFSGINGEKYRLVFAPLLYIFIVGIIYIISLIIIWKYIHKLYRKIKSYVHMTVTNCAILGGLFINSQSGAGFWSSMGYGIGTVAGFFVAGYLLYVAHERLNSELVPAAFRGMPIMIIYVGVLSMALHAFAGYVVV